MTERYFIDQAGTRITRPARPGEGHLEIAKEVLPRLGIVPQVNLDHYRQMYRLQYVRVVDRDDGTVEFVHGPALTPAQQEFIEGMRRQGRKIELKQANL